MNTRQIKTEIASVLLWAAAVTALHAQSTAFTYQGSLAGNGQPLSGPAEFQFTLWDAATAGTQIAATNPEDTVASVTNGLFSVSLDFGAAAFDGADRWLEIKTRTTLGDFTTLTPRQRISAAPYALRARSVAAEGLASGTYSNAVTFSNPANVFTGDGSGLTGIHSLAAADGTPTEAAFVDADGNVGIGITSPQAALHVVGSILAGDNVNSISSGTVGAVIAGGGQPGFANSIGANANYSTISGGRGNEVADDVRHTFIGGGQANTVQANYGIIGGGIGNIIRNSSFYSTIAGGWDNDIQINSASCVIGGGEDNIIGNNSGFATIPGGHSNYVGAPYAFAAGRRARANHTGAFVWADSEDADSNSARNNQFRVRADGGVYLDLNNSHWVEFRRQSSLTLSARIIYTSTGAYLSEGGIWSNASDAARKENFEPVDGREVLEAVSRLPIHKWNYRIEQDDIRHLGPTAQDFQAAFGLGGDDKAIATVDADGVALAAIQGLNEKVEVRSQKAEVSIRELKGENAVLKARLEKLEQQLAAFAGKGIRQ